MSNHFHLYVPKELVVVVAEGCCLLVRGNDGAELDGKGGGAIVGKLGDGVSKLSSIDSGRGVLCGTVCCGILCC